MTDNTPTASQLASILGAKEKSNLSDELHNLLFGVRRSVYYHLHMRNFYDRFNLLCSSILISVFGYCYSLLKTSGGEQIAPLAAVLVTVLFMLNLAVRSLWKARLYHDFYRRFVALEPVYDPSIAHFPKQHLVKKLACTNHLPIHLLMSSFFLRHFGFLGYTTPASFSAS